MSSGLLTQVEPQQQQPRSMPMETVRYHRDQAALCLQIARLLSDPLAARLMRMAAARHCEQVAELEDLCAAPSGNLRSDDNGRDDFSDSFYYRAIRTRIGEALRSQLVPTEPPPGKVFYLLQALDRPRVDAVATDGNCEPPAKSRAEKSMEKVDTAIDTIERLQGITTLDNK